MSDMMKDNNSDSNILTIGIFAHANAGKTTITEHLLYHTNIIKYVGRVDSGNTISDSLSLERERGISIRASLVSFTLGDKIIQLIDTPGHIDFSAEVERAITVLDAAILVISGVEGIEPQTYTIWKALKDKEIPIIIFINKMDREGANYTKVINDLKIELDRNIFPLFSIDTNNKIINIKHAENKNIIDFLSNIDDEILETYINEGNINTILINKKLTTLINMASVYPVLGGSALADIGIEQLLYTINFYIKGFDREKYIHDSFSAYVYMVRKESGSRNIYAKILAGSINVRDKIKNSLDEQEKIRGLYKIHGSTLLPASYATCGDIVIMNGITCNSGELLGDKTKYIDLKKFVNPLIIMQISPIEKGRILELVDALKVLNEEDPYLNARYDNLSGRIYINLIGLVQGEVIENMLLERFNIKVALSDPLVIHKETPSCESTGGSSYTMFSAIEFKITPRPRDSGLIYNTKLSTDYLHKKYQLQAERLVARYIQQGLYGWEVTDAEISLIGGRFNSAGSDPSHFNIIIPLALTRALKKSDIKILEPISSLKLTIPKEFLHISQQSLKNRSASFSIMKEDEKQITLTGEAPSKNILNYQSEIIEITSGRGIFTSNLVKYEISRDQNIYFTYHGSDPRNEVKFVMGEMLGDLNSLDIEYSKNKKSSRSKFKRRQQEKKK